MANLPEVDELVLATVKKILPYGAFCTLDEYGKMEAFLHISEVAPRWIKNIREFLYEGQHLVAKVHNVVPEKNQIDISLKRLTEAEKKRKLENVRHGRRAEKLFEVAIKQAKSTTAEGMAARKALSDKYGGLIEAFDQISETGEKALDNLQIEKGLAAALAAVAQKSMHKTKAELKAVVHLVSYAPDGIKHVQAALAGISAPKEDELEINYLGAPRYQISISAHDFKDANKALEKIKEQIEACAKKGDIAVQWEEIKE